MPWLTGPFRSRPRPLRLCRLLGCGARLACEADFERLVTWTVGYGGQAVLESGRAE